MAYCTLVLANTAIADEDTQQSQWSDSFCGDSGNVTHKELVFNHIKSVEDLNKEVATASAQGQSVMLYFYADWCVSCKEMEKKTFSDPRIIKVLYNTRLLLADITANDHIDQTLIQGHFGLPGPPVIIFYNINGQEEKTYRVIGFVPADKFIDRIRQAIPSLRGRANNYLN
ncbi:MAG: thioredoxin family protein [Candidatus Thiodiazotropha sp. (ex Gloverina cf. vestifex)]|nr:thioredoxin family protein [Candidatus Thiodiazotropha sp. (ex Gloverina cf. vestifex)]